MTPNLPTTITRRSTEDARKILNGRHNRRATVKVKGVTFCRPLQNPNPRVRFAE